ncbi:MAG: alpha-galactosidase [Eubacteriales bacterium]|nr:alpha-galactosidase [Eubacteriales bacterium]
MQRKKSGLLDYCIDADESRFEVRVQIVPEEPGLEYLEIALHAEQEEKLPEVRVSWTVPHCDIQGIWRPDGAEYPLPNVWGRAERTEATFSAPVACLFAFSGRNRCTVAFSDAQELLEQKWALREEDVCWVYEARLFCAPEEDASDRTVRFRIDLRDIAYEESLNGVAQWWQEIHGQRKIPDFCRLPTYSTWYSYHEAPESAQLERQARLASAVGCRSMILDDGWQMEDSSRSYRYCGDWKVCEKEFPDMCEHVRAVHKTGLKYMVWFAVPFVGKYSQAWERFQGMFLPGDGDTRCLDPRYPAVRAYLLERILGAAADWRIDGCKLDFIDWFRQPEREDPEALPGRDFRSVSRAVVRLLEEMWECAARNHPEFAMEFRQSYTGPVMRRFATMFRVADCPGDFRQNKVCAINLRLLAGATPVHSDMLLWHTQENAREVALQLQHILFCVPQISVRLEEMQEDVAATLRYWLAFWTEHRGLLLDGTLRAEHPEMGYSCICAERARERMIAIYAEGCIDLSGKAAMQTIVNARREKGVVCRLKQAAAMHVVIRNYRGQIVEESLQTREGLFELAIPGCGLAQLSCVP